MQVIKKSIALVGPTLPQMHGNLIFTYYSKFLLFIFFFFFWGGGGRRPDCISGSAPRREIMYKLYYIRQI